MQVGQVEFSESAALGSLLQLRTSQYERWRNNRHRPPSALLAICSPLRPPAVRRTGRLQLFLHWKTMIFAGQGKVEFSGANYTGSEFVPVTPYVEAADHSGIIAEVNRTTTVTSLAIFSRIMASRS